MTRINRLTIHGFKSFAHKTDIPFDTKYNVILGPNGSGKCVTGDTVVQLANGTLIPIKELLNSKANPDKCQKIDDGFIYEADGTEILCLNTETYKIEKRPIKNYVKRTAPKALLKIKTRSGREITSTPYHPLFILKDNQIVSARADELAEGIKIAVPREVNVQPSTKVFYELLNEIKPDDRLYIPWSPELEKTLKENKNISWNEVTRVLELPKTAIKSFFDKQAINFAYLVRILRHLKIGDDTIINLIPRVKAKVSAKTYPFPWKNSPELARLLGYLLSEGRSTASNQIWFTNGTEEIVQDYASLMQRMFSENVTINEYKANAWDVLTYSQPIQVIFSKFGLKRGGRTADKKIPSMYLSHCTEAELVALLDGLYSGDGYVSKNSIEITTKSKNLAFAIQTILTRLGILFQTREVIKIATNSGFSGRYHSISIYGQENFSRFAELVTFTHPAKQGRLLKLTGKKGNTNIDLIEINSLVKKAAQDCGINIKKMRKEFCKIDAYCYNQCLPSRTEVQELIENIFTDSNQMQSVMQLHKLAYSDVYWDEITHIEEIKPAEEWVYDLCVEEHHNFIANNIYVHNSNIGDSLCFVLGRISAKSMRAEKAANLIFNGGKNKKPADKAYVEIAFDNSEKIFPLNAKEVVINRTITKTGNSIYKINGEKHTRSEIVDLLSAAKINPDGYNVILQGDITRFVDMAPLERRKIIEEISDVSIYEDKKHKALLELQKVEEKLNNAEIILKERKTHLKELKKDRDQALQFKELQDQIDSHKATFLHIQIQEREQIKNKHDQEIQKNQEKITESEQKIEELKKRIAEKKQQVSHINYEIEQKGEKEQLKVHKEIEDLKVELAKERARMSTLKDEINKIKLRKDQFQHEIKELEDKFAAHSKQQKELLLLQKQKQNELKELEERIGQFKKKNKIESSQELETEIEEKDKIIELKQEEIQQIRQKQQELLREKDKIEYQLQTIDERIRKVKEVEQENKQQIKQLQEYKNNFKAATLRLNKLLDEDSSLAAQLGNARRKLVDTQERHAKANAKTASLQASLASNQAVKSILDNRRKFKEVYGTVAELGQVNKKYSLALEQAAGGKMQHLVVDTDQTAAECIKYLQQNKLGSASFIPLNKIKYQDISEEDKKLLKLSGVHDFALNLISFKSQFKRAFANVFGNTLVVDDIDVARKVGVGRIKIATLDGNLVEGSGVMRGGYLIRKSSLGFKEKDSLEELEKLETEIEQTRAIITNIELKRETNEQEISALRMQKAELEGEIIKLEKTLHLETGDLEATQDLKKELQQQLKQNDQQTAEVQRNITLINKELAELKSKKNMLRSEVNLLRDPRLLAQLTAFEEAKQKCREDIIRIDNDLKNRSSQMEQLLAPEKEKIMEIIKQHSKEEEEFKEEIKHLTETTNIKERDLQEKEKESKEFYSKYKELFTQREKLGTEITKAENEIENVRENSRTHERELNLISLKNAEIKAKLAGLQEEFKKYTETPLLKGKTVPELQKEISRFEVLLSQTSTVNMKALEIYEQVETEFNKLLEKKESLEKEKTDVLTFMNEIETKKKDHFMKTFSKANENFQRIFSQLFKKGKASLLLDNPNQPFEDGLSIKVKLTGNRFMDIKSLSGGEKTLTALSFIFAIQEYQPASFYILDEIDAALDKHNSETLAKLIRNYADGAQYIVISHNDSVISEADSLYGISMNEGVSKVTSLKI